MPGSDLAELLDLATASDARSLHQLATAAAAVGAGLLGGERGIWRTGEPQLVASTHPDLPGLVEVQLDAGRGPALAALAQAAGRSAARTRSTEERWPEYAQAALRDRRPVLAHLRLPGRLRRGVADACSAPGPGRSTRGRLSPRRRSARLAAPCSARCRSTAMPGGRRASSGRGGGPGGRRPGQGHPDARARLQRGRGPGADARRPHSARTSGRSTWRGRSWPR